MMSSATSIPAPASTVPSSARRGRFVLNLATNLGHLTLTLVVGAWYVPFLVRDLGAACYGLIPLATTITSYMALITLALNSAVGRSLTIALEQNEPRQANLVFNTSLWGSMAMCAILLLPVVAGLLCLESLVRIPPGLASATRWLFAGTATAFLLNQIKTPFDVSSFCRNRFDLRNLVATCEVLMRVGLVVILFYVLRPGIEFVGCGIVCGTVISMLGAIVLWRVLTPELRIDPRLFDWTILGDLTRTGGWAVVNHLGAILYLGIDLLVANRLFGVEQSGKYAAVLQLPLLVRTLGSTIAGVFSPTALYYFAKQDYDGLVQYVRQALKCVGLMLALPIALMCGFAEPLLRLWLGPDFIHMGPLLCLLTAHLCVNVSVLPLLGLHLAANRMKVPGLVTLIMGLGNLGLALLLAGPLRCGLYGIAWAGAIMLTSRHLLFTPLYTAHILRRGYLTFFPELGLTALATASTVILCRAILCFAAIETWAHLVWAGLVVSLSYGFLVYGFLLSREDRRLLHRLLPFRKDQRAASTSVTERTKVGP